MSMYCRVRFDMMVPPLMSKVKGVAFAGYAFFIHFDRIV